MPRKKKPGTRDADETGISVFLERCYDQNLFEIVKRTERRPLVGIIRLSVASLKKLGMTLNFEPADCRCHFVIPELNCNRYQDDNSALILLAQNLADKVQYQDCVFWTASNNEVSLEPTIQA